MQQVPEMQRKTKRRDASSIPTSATGICENVGPG